MDKALFQKEILTLRDKMFRLAKSILQNKEAAEDTVQEISLKLWEKRAELDKVENIQAFTLRSVRNHCLDIIKTHKYFEELTPESEYEDQTPHLQTEQRDMVERIKKMIDFLPELQRTIIRLRDVEGLEFAEIAVITGQSENAIRVNLSRGRQTIREKILNEQRKTDKTIWKEQMN